MRRSGCGYYGSRGLKWIGLDLPVTFASSLPGCAAGFGQLPFVPRSLDSLVMRLQLIQLQIGQPLDIDHLVSRVIGGADQLVQLQIDGARIAILRVLNKEDHEKRHQRRSRADDLRPAV